MKFLQRALEVVPPEVLARSICVVDREKVRVTELPVGGAAPR